MDRRQGLGNDSAGSCPGAAGVGSVCFGVVRVVEAGKAVGDDLRGGLGSGFGGSLLIRESVWRLPAPRRWRLQRPDHVGLRRGSVGLRACDDENLLKLIKVSGGTKLDERVGLMIGVGLDGLDGPDRKTARIDLIAAGA